MGIWCCNANTENCVARVRLNFLLALPSHPQSRVSLPSAYHLDRDAVKSDVPASNFCSTDITPTEITEKSLLCCRTGMRSKKRHDHRLLSRSDKPVILTLLTVGVFSFAVIPQRSSCLQGFQAIYSRQRYISWPGSQNEKEAYDRCIDAHQPTAHIMQRVLTCISVCRSRSHRSR